MYSVKIRRRLYLFLSFLFLATPLGISHQNIYGQEIEDPSSTSFQIFVPLISGERVTTQENPPNATAPQGGNLQNHDDEYWARLTENEPRWESPGTVRAAAASNVGGEWGPVITWPHTPVSIANLPDGRVLTWSGSEREHWPSTEQTYSATWDPATGTFSEYFNDNHNMFCSDLISLDDGRIMALGGRNTVVFTSIFDPVTNQWARVQDMNSSRWYPTSTTLADGSVFTAVGKGGPYPERWNESSGWTRLTGVNLQAPILNYGTNKDGAGWWPLMHLDPRGNIFHYGATPVMHSINPNGNGSLTTLGNSNLSWYPEEAVAILYDEGKILVAGGAQNSGTNTSSNKAAIIDINNPTPQITTIASMNHARQFANEVVLPDGTVLVIGGNTSGTKFSDNGTVLDAELWDPTTQGWTLLNPMSVPRNYHSTAILLVDGRVLSGGGGYSSGNPNHPATHTDGQVFSPPYLFDGAGSPVVRPTVTNAPNVVGIGQSFNVQGSNNIARFTMIRNSATTHTMNTGQRFLEVPFTQLSSGNFQLTAHSNANVLLPGYWMLFGLTNDGVPSVAKMVQVRMSVPTASTPGPYRYVKFVAESEVNGKPWSSAAEVNILDGNGAAINRSDWTISADSEETVGEDGRATNAIDGNSNSIWHTEWYANSGDDNDPPHPHQLIIDMGIGYELSGLRYLPRPGGGNGTISQYNVQLSEDGVNWSLPVAQGTFANNQAEKLVSIDSGSAIFNLARGKITTQSSTGFGGVPSRAIDGDNDGVYNNGSITHTQNEANAWWEVDLGRQHNLTTISLWNRTDCCSNRLSNFHVFVSDDPFDSTSLSATQSQDGVTEHHYPGEAGRTTEFTINRAGRYVRVQLGGTNFLQLAEVEIFGTLDVPSEPISIDPLTTTPAQVNTAVNYIASASGGPALQYKWVFGDGTAETTYSSSPNTSHTFNQPGRYEVTLTVQNEGGNEQSIQFYQAIYTPQAANRPMNSSTVAYQVRSGNDQIWGVNPDNSSVTVIDATTEQRVAIIPVGQNPSAVAIRPSSDTVWVINRDSATISVINGTTLSVENTMSLPRGSKPHGVVFDSGGFFAYVTLEALGQVVRVDPDGLIIAASVTLGEHVRHLTITPDSTRLLVSRFITPRLPGEETQSIQTNGVGGEVMVVNLADMTLNNTITLQVNTDADFEAGARGVPNYLAAPVISPDGQVAWVPSKQDNILRGGLRDGNDLNFEHTVRAISSHINLGSFSETFAARIDHDNASVANAGTFGLYGNYLFVTLETSREVVVVDAYGQNELFRFDTGLAPQGIVLSADGMTLYVHNFMERSIGIHDISALMNSGAESVSLRATVDTITSEQLTANVLRGKQLFYDARDPRLARDAYMSCASCHNAGDSDGRIWDMTAAGEGLRNTISLVGHGAGNGPLHWSANFDEVQDFEGQIRTMAGGTGLMSNSDFNATSEPLGASKAGLSSELDALAAYVNSLTTVAESPYRNQDGTLTSAAVAGKAIFETANCASCHTGSTFTDSTQNQLHDVGTIKPSSGSRLGGNLTGIDTPTLLGLWETGPYLHDGSAATLEEAITAHNGVSLSGTELTQLVAFVQQLNAADAPPASLAEYNFDFGTDTSPVENGWTQVTPATNSGVVSWSGATVDSRDRGTGGGVNDINRDFVFGSGVTTLNLNIGNGTWQVTMNMGDLTHAHDNMIVKAEGETINSDIDNAVGEFVYVGRGTSGGPQSFDVVVNDGLLNIELSDGGGNPHWVLTRLSLTRVESIANAVGQWRMDESIWNGTTSEVIDSSGNGYNGTAVNGASTDSTIPAIAGDPGTCGYGIFNGSDQSVTAPYQAALNPDDFTIAFWIRVDGGSDTWRSAITSRWEGDGANLRRGFIVYAADNNRWQFWTGIGGAGWDLLEGPTVVEGAWTHLAVSFQTTGTNGNIRTGTKTMYINGLQVAQKTGDYHPNLDNPLTIGAGGNVGTQYFFNGAIDEMSLYNSALSESAMPQLVNATHVCPSVPTNSAPTITNPGDQTTTEGDSVQLSINASDADGDTLTYSTSGLPTGLSIDGGSGAISGSPLDSGIYSVTVNVSDGTETSSATFAWTVDGEIIDGNPVPIYTDALASGWSQGSWVGVSVDLANGSPVAVGSSSISFTYDEGGSTLYFQNATALDAANYQAVRFQVYGTANDQSINVSILDSAFQNSTLYSVAPVLNTWTEVTIPLSRFGAVPDILYILFANPEAGSQPVIYLDEVVLIDTGQAPGNTAPTVDLLSDQIHLVGDTVNLPIVANDAEGDPLTYSATDLPAGLVIESSSGVISGSPTGASTYNVTISVSDGVDTTTSNFAWTIEEAISGGNPVTIYTDGLAPGWSQGSWVGVSVDLANGSPVAAGNNSISFTYDEGGSTLYFQSATALDAANYQALRFQVYGTANGQSINVSILDSAFQNSTLYSVTPALNTWTEVTIPLSRFGAVPDILYILLANPEAVSQPVIYLDEVMLIDTGQPPANTPPTLNGNLIDRVNDEGDAVNLTLTASDADGDVLTYSATGLPNGLSIDNNSGNIGGTTTTAGTYNATVIVDDGNGGTDSASFNWTVNAITLPPTDADLILEYTLDRSAVPPLYYNGLTLNVITGPADRIVVAEDGRVIPHIFDAASGITSFTTSGSEIKVYLNGQGTPFNFGVISVAPLKENKKFAWSIGFDDNTGFLPAIDVLNSYGYRGTVFAITDIIDDTREQDWIIDAPGMKNILAQGWSLAPHGRTTSCDDYNVTDTSLAFDRIEEIVGQSAVPDYLVTAFAAPCFIAYYHPIILQLRDGGTYDVQFNESGDRGLMRVEPGVTDLMNTNTTRIAYPLNLQLTPSDNFNQVDRDDPIGRDLSIELDLTGAKATLDWMAANATNGRHFWYNTFQHGSDGVALTDFLNHLQSNYEDDVLVAPSDEIYSYLLVRDLTVVTGGPAPANRPPSLTNPGNQSSDIDETVSLSLSATDADSDILSFSATGLPTGLAVDAVAGTIAGTITDGGTFNVVISVDDGNGGTDSVSFEWVVNGGTPLNNPPLLTNPGDQNHQVGSGIGLTVSASDPDGDPVTFDATGLPAGLTIDESSGLISGSPTAPGVNAVTITASDGTDVVSVNLTWTIDGPIVGPAIPIYQDAMANSWSNGHWSNVTINPSNTSVVAAGSHSLAFTYDDPYSTLFFLSGTALAATDYQAVRFQIYGTESGQQFNVAIMNSAYQTSNTYQVTPLLNQWLEVTIPLGEFGTLSDIFYVLFANPQGGSQSVIYLDELVLIGQEGVGPINNPPTLTNPGDQSHSVNGAVNLTLSATDADGHLLSYSATDLPSGLNIDSATGTISGTPTTAGSYAVVASVDDGNGGTDSVTFNWTINEPAPGNNPPVLTNPGDQTHHVGESTSLPLSAIDADGHVLTFGATGLPTGLAIDSATGIIAGTPTTEGTSSVTITVDDGNGGTDNATFAWTINPAPPINNPPVVTSPGDQTHQVGSGVGLTISASDPDGDSVTFSATGLPAGLVIDGASGLISGTPTTPGVYAVTITASDGTDSASIELTWTIDGPIVGPAIPIYQDALANGWSSGHWSNVTINPSNTSAVAVGSNSLAFTYDDPYSTLFFLSGTVLPATDYQAVRFQIYGTESGQQFNVALMNSSYQTSNTYRVTPLLNQWLEVTIPLGEFGALDDILYILFANPQGNAQPIIYLDELVLVGQEGVGPVNNPPTLTNPNNQSSVVNDVVNLTLSATDVDGDSLTFGASGLPTGLTIDSATGTIAGTVTEVGTFGVVVSVDDGNGGTDSASLDWIVSDGATGNNPPVLINPSDQVNNVGSAVNLALSATDADGHVLTYSATNLPPGLAIDSGTGTIAGTPTTAGNHTVVASVDDGNGGTDSTSFSWTINEPTPGNNPPLITNPGPQTHQVGATVSLTVSASDADGDVVTFGATGLPIGLAVDGVSGLINGSPTVPGVYNVSLTASDGTDTSSAALTWTIEEADAPIVGPMIPIYQDAIASGWSSGHWSNVTINPSHTSEVAMGSNSLAFTYDDPYSTLFFLSGTALSAVDYQAVRFQIYGTESGQQFNVAIMNSAYQTSNTYQVTPLLNQWQEITIPLDEFGSLDNILYVLLSNPQGGSQSVLYLDELVLIGRDGPTNNLPTLTNPGSQWNLVDDAVNLTVTGEDADGDPLTFGATGLPTGLTMSNNGSISGIASSAGTYTVVLTVSDGNGGTSSTAFTWTVREPGPGAPAGPTGQIGWQYWNTEWGASLSILRNSPNFPDSPDGSDMLTAFEAPTDRADTFGQRINGYIYPPVSGDYTFWIASDDNGELWLSTDDAITNLALIATVDTWTGVHQWDLYPSQQSATISLVAGQPYYIEALAQEGGGGDNLSVAWQVPGGVREVIDGQYLAPNE
ncbi:MAG: putative Ig domain-containing protein [Chloroflexota bacterium]